METFKEADEILIGAVSVIIKRTDPEYRRIHKKSECQQDLTKDEDEFLKTRIEKYLHSINYKLPKIWEFVQLDDPVESCKENQKILDALPIELLTVDVIRKRFWDPVKKVCKPIVCYSTQMFGCGPSTVPDFNNIDGINIRVVTFTGTLITESRKQKDWLSKTTPGPYKKNLSNQNKEYYLETIEEQEDGSHTIPIGCPRCIDDIYNPLHRINNILVDGDEYLELWIEKIQNAL